MTYYKTQKIYCIQLQFQYGKQVSSHLKHQHNPIEVVLNHYLITQFFYFFYFVAQYINHIILLVNT